MTTTASPELPNVPHAETVYNLVPFDQAGVTRSEILATIRSATPDFKDGTFKRALDALLNKGLIQASTPKKTGTRGRPPAVYVRTQTQNEVKEE